MATRASIAADLRKARRQASALEEAAEKLKRVAGTNGLGGSLNMVSNNWTGESARSYLQKGNDLQRMMYDSAADLKETAETIRTVAQNIYEAELENIRMQESRRSSSSSGSGGGR